MRLPFLLRGAVFLFWYCIGITAAQASHSISIDLTYAYAGTAASPNQYRVTVRQIRDAGSTVSDLYLPITCGKNECGTALPGSFSAQLPRISDVLVTSGCATGLYSSYGISTFEGLVQLPPAAWTLSVNAENRQSGILNVANSVMMSIFVKAELNNTNGVVNSSPRFNVTRLLQLTTTVPQQRHSLSAFDSEGDSLVYQLVQPYANPAVSQPCGVPTIGDIAPYFQLNAATGELLTVAGPAQQGRFVLAVRVNEFRRLNGAWQQIGSIMRDMAYTVTVGTNQVPAFTRVAPTSRPTDQLLGQTIRVNPGQTLALTLTAADADAGQMLSLNSEAGAVVPGATFQDLGNGQARLTWQVPATIPPGRYTLAATATDNSCPVPGATALTLAFLVTRQALASNPQRQLAQPPFPMPFSDVVRFQISEVGSQVIVISDALGRTVTQLKSTAEGRVAWQPAPHLPAGLYFARNTGGTQVSKLQYSGR